MISKKTALIAFFLYLIAMATFAATYQYEVVVYVEDKLLGPVQETYYVYASSENAAKNDAKAKFAKDYGPFSSTITVKSCKRLKSDEMGGLNPDER
jgi:hypothetical protein